MSEIMGTQGIPSKDRFQKISKIEAAKRQLVTAIRLFLSEEDAIPVHTIASAVHEVLRDLLIKKGGKSFLKDGITVFLHPEDIEDYQIQIREPQNFLKHANRDPEGTLDFSPDIVRLWIFDCLRMYMELTGTMFKEGNLFSIWFVLSHPKFVLPGKYPPEFEKIAESFEPTKEFFLKLLERDDLPDLPQIVFHIPA